MNITACRVCAGRLPLHMLPAKVPVPVAWQALATMTARKLGRPMRHLPLALDSRAVMQAFVTVAIGVAWSTSAGNLDRWCCSTAHRVPHTKVFPSCSLHVLKPTIAAEECIGLSQCHDGSAKSPQLERAGVAMQLALRGLCQKACKQSDMPAAPCLRHTMAC